MMRKSKRKSMVLLVWVLLGCLCLISGCVRERPELLPEYTLPVETPEPTPDPTPQATQTPDPTPTVAPEFDALGRFVSSSPVSYTHLDVYKRQIKKNPQART